MAQSLEKAFLQKVAQMPQEELELAPPPQRIKPGKPGRKGRGNAGEPRLQAGQQRQTHDHIFLSNFKPILLYIATCYSLWWSDDGSSGSGCLPVRILASYPGNTRFHPVHPPTDSFDQKFAPFLCNRTEHAYHYRSASYTAHC